MRPLVAVKIIHDIKNRLIYNLYAEFFRFWGIYVGEGTIDDYTKVRAREDRECFQLFFCVSEASNKHEVSNSTVAGMDEWKYINVGEYKDILWSFTDRDKDGLKLKMEETLDAAWISLNVIEFPVSLLKNILGIYIEENVLEASCQLQYYRLKSKLHKKEEGIFRAALTRLEKLPNDGIEQFGYLDYAMLYCKQKINLSCFCQKNKLLGYIPETLAQECCEVLEAYPDFSNVWVLIGMIYENFEDAIKKAIEAYRRAIIMEKEECYASHIYYWIGYLYEKYEDYDSAEYAYEKAYKLKKKYRNIYKKAKMAERRGEYLQELQYYDECLRHLEQKKSMMMDPLEIEYYYKTNVLACHNCVFKQERYDRAKEYGERAYAFYEELQKPEKKYFKYFYGERAEEYQKISLKRINPKKLYECLAIVYRKLGDTERADRFWRKVDVLELKMRA